MRSLGQEAGSHHPRIVDNEPRRNAFRSTPPCHASKNRAGPTKAGAPLQALNDQNLPSGPESLTDRLARIEQRLARLETRLELAAVASPLIQTAAPAPADSGVTVLAIPPEVAPGAADDEIEFQVGQSWFAQAGIFALTIGVGFMLSLPYSGVPPWVPSLAGFAVVGVLFALIHFAGKAIDLVANPLRGAGMLLMCLAAWRLFFPTSHASLPTDSLGGQAFLLFITGVNTAAAWRRNSAWLLGLALLLGAATALFVGEAGFVLLTVAILSIVGVAAGERAGWPILPLATTVLVNATYLVWALGNPLRGGILHFNTEPTAGPLVLLFTSTGFAVGLLRRTAATAEAEEDTLSNVGTFLNCALGYGLFLLHTAVGHGASLVILQAIASVVFLGLAVLYWVRRRSHIATFFYAMTGYGALSVAIMKAAMAPEVFVWLSLQSVLVVATAIWFRSRFIVVANFLILVGIMLAYLVVAESETGFSVGFGIVALLSARILNWKKERLKLKTELMRNAYLLSAFLVFPYSLYHLISIRYVAVAWVGLASLYYVLNLFIHSQKYRWMGHGTLGLAMCYAVISGVRGFDPVYRVLTFLVLGTALLIVAVSFNRALRRRQATPKP